MLKRFRGRRKWLLLAGAAPALLLAGMVAILFPQQILTVESGPVQADVIVVLGGGSGERAVRAAELFQQGAAPRVIVSGNGDAAWNRRILVRRQVPPAAIELEPDSRSTRENATFTIARLRAAAKPVALVPDKPAPNVQVEPKKPRQKTRVILVTSWWHSRRALCCFEHYAPEMVFYSRPAYFGYPRSEWKLQGMRRYVRLEYIKLLGYWLGYGVWPV